MRLDFNGAVLRKPRMAATNAPTTGEADVAVRAQDEAAYRQEVVADPQGAEAAYLVHAAHTGNLCPPAAREEVCEALDGGLLYRFNARGEAVAEVLSVDPAPLWVDARRGLAAYAAPPTTPPRIAYRPAPLQIHWARNDARRLRFGFDERAGRWECLAGGPPQILGAVGDANLRLPVLDVAGKAALVLGAPDRLANPAPAMALVGDAEFEGYGSGALAWPTGLEAAVRQSDGSLLFAPDVVAQHRGRSVYYFRDSFAGDTAPHGPLGLVGDAAGLFLNPVPLDGEYPRLSIGHRSMLLGQQGAMAVPQDGYDFAWHPDSGRIAWHPDVIAAHEGKPVYYRGAYNKAFVPPHAPVDLGDIEDADPLQTAALAAVDPALIEAGQAFFCAQASGQGVAAIDVVDALTPSLYLHPQQAQVERSTGRVQMAYAFRKAHAGERLLMASRGFALERGISFWLEPAPSGPDAVARAWVEDEALVPAIFPGPSLSLNQVPLEDVPGYGTDAFFRVASGAQVRTLAPDVDVVYDFDQSQILWAQPEAYAAVVTRATTSIAMPHQVLVPRGYDMTLDEGRGFMPLSPESAVINADAGAVQFVRQYGAALAQGVGQVTAEGHWHSPGADFGPVAALDFEDPARRPALILGPRAHRVESVVGDTLVLETPLAPETLPQAFEVLAGAEIVYRYAWEDAGLRRRAVYPFVSFAVATGDRLALDVAEDLFFVASFQGDGGTPQVVVPVVLSPEVLGPMGEDALYLPEYYRAPQARHALSCGDVALTRGFMPAPGVYAVDAQDGRLLFDATDQAALSGLPVALTPLPSVGATGVEVLMPQGEVYLPEAPGVAWAVRVGVPESAYAVQRNLLYFNRPFRRGEGLFVRYQDQAGAWQEEDVGFRVSEKVGVASGQFSVAFGAGRLLDLARPAQVLVNGAPSRLVPNLATKTVAGVEGVRKGRRLEVAYHALDAGGGERSAALLKEPRVANLRLVAGSGQAFEGRHDARLVPGTLLWVGAYCGRVVGSQYDAARDVTMAILSPAVPADRALDASAGSARLSSGPVAMQSSAPGANLRLARPSRGEMQVLLTGGDATGLVHPQSVMYVAGDPYPVQDVTYVADQDATRVALAVPLMQDYAEDAPLAFSDVPVYAGGPQTMTVGDVALDGASARVVRMGAGGEGDVFLLGQGFAWEALRQVVLDPAVVPRPRAGEVWSVAYTAQRVVGPKRFAGQLFYPRFRAQYSRRVNATRDNGLLGATIRARYAFACPDAFFFEVLPLADYAARVAEEAASSDETNQGPVATLPSPGPLYTRGVGGLVWEGGELRDRDRAARRQLAYYHRAASQCERLLEVADGRVVGDADGKFAFAVGEDDTPGGEDPVTGELIPYYANPFRQGLPYTAQEIAQLGDLALQQGAVQNGMDDVALVSKKPLRTLPGLPPSAEFQGTYRPLWKPSALSRLYPQARKVATTTAPAQGGGPDYAFPGDFGAFLADAGVEGILSVSRVQKRRARARITAQAYDASTGLLTLYAAMTYDPATGALSNAPYAIDTGDPTAYVPAFAVGDHVNLGRVAYDGEGQAAATVYAQNLVVQSVMADRLVLATNPYAAQHPDVETTPTGDVAAIYGDTVFAVAPVVVDPAQSPPKPFYESPLDFGVNAAEGELLNATLPAFLADAVGQSRLAPNTPLDIAVAFANRRTEPYRFGALDGDGRDDDGDHALPLRAPLLDSEVRRLEEESALLAWVRTTVPGLVVPGALVLSGTHVDLGPADLGPYAAHTGDALHVGQVMAEPLGVGELVGTALYAAAFAKAGAVQYALESLYEGAQGQRDGANPAVWRDAGVNFALFAGASLSLHVGGSTYAVVDVALGQVTASAPIVETDGPYRLSAQGVGTVPDNLAWLESGSVSFANARGALVLTGDAALAGTYEAQGGASGRLYRKVWEFAPGSYVDVGLSLAPVEAEGVGAVRAGDSALVVPGTPAMAVGDTVLVNSQDANSGRYTVAAVALDGDKTVLTLVPALRASTGDPDAGQYPTAWRAKRPRRASLAAQALSVSHGALWPLYEFWENAPEDVRDRAQESCQNPGAPARDALRQLHALAFGDAVGDGAATVDASLAQIHWQAEVAVESGDYAWVGDGPNRGFYRVVEVEPLGSGQRLLVDTQNAFITYPLTSGDVDRVIVYHSQGLLSARSQELILYESLLSDAWIADLEAALRAQGVEGDALTLPSAPYGRPGDWADEDLDARLLQVGARLLWVRDAASNLRAELEGVLRGEDALYDTRFAWIDYRANLATGTLPARERFEEARAKRQRARRDKRLLTRRGR